MRLGVLASGSGTILRAILDAGIPVALVVTDRECPALEHAAAFDVPAVVVPRATWGPDFDRDAYTGEITETLQSADIDVVAMAGFMTVLGPAVFAALPGRILNTHPALLPSFRGAHAVRDALAYGVKVTGTTVHLATPAVDDGPILAQEAVPVLDGDTEATLQERIKAVERRLYPQTLATFLEDLTMTNGSGR